MVQSWFIGTALHRQDPGNIGQSMSGNATTSPCVTATTRCGSVEMTLISHAVRFATTWLA